MTMTVVVIEDEPATRDLIVGYLMRRGNRVTGCGTLVEAALALFELQPDAVVSDVSLPDGNGADFCLERAADLPRARWLIMSAQPEMVRHARAMAKRPQAPSVVVLDKPVSLRAFDDFLRHPAPAARVRRSSAADGQFDHVP